MTHHFNSKILLMPGLWNSGEQHWQTHLEKNLGFERLMQDNWETPRCEDWIARVDEYATPQKMDKKKSKR